MADYYNLTREDFKEVLTDRELFYKNINSNQNTELDQVTKFGQVKMSSKNLGEIGISFFDLNLNRNIKIKDTLQPNICFNILRKGHSSHILSDKKFNQYDFEAMQCNLLFSNHGGMGQSIYQKNTFTQYDTVHFSDKIFEKLNNYYPNVLGNLYRRYKNGETFIYNNRTIPFTYEMDYILSQIKNSTIIGNARNMYIEAKIIELLAILFSDDQHRKSDQCAIIKTTADKNKIMEAKNILVTKLMETPSIHQLAKEVGINERKLREGFKEIYGNTVFGFLFQHKMQLAAKYLINTDSPINEIAIICGYEYSSHFSTAFKRYYGCTPLQYRLNKKK